MVGVDAAVEDADEHVAGAVGDRVGLVGLDHLHVPLLGLARVRRGGGGRLAPRRHRWPSSWRPACSCGAPRPRRRRSRRGCPRVTPTVRVAPTDSSALPASAVTSVRKSHGSSGRRRRRSPARPGRRRRRPCPRPGSEVHWPGLACLGVEDVAEEHAVGGDDRDRGRHGLGGGGGRCGAGETRGAEHGGRGDGHEARRRRGVRDIRGAAPSHRLGSGPVWGRGHPTQQEVPRFATRNWVKPESSSGKPFGRIGRLRTAVGPLRRARPPGEPDTTGQWLETAFSAPAPVSERTSISANFASLCSFEVMVPM